MEQEQEDMGVPASPSLASPSGLSPASGSSRSGIANAEQRIADLELALGYALDILIEFEPPDSRAVSSEFVAMAAIHADLDELEECREIIRSAASAMSARSDETQSGSVRKDASAAREAGDAHNA